jgi:thiol-disulfide isomerase/thioredoxin
MATPARLRVPSRPRRNDHASVIDGTRPRRIRRGSVPFAAVRVPRRVGVPVAAVRVPRRGGVPAAAVRVPKRVAVAVAAGLLGLPVLLGGCSGGTGQAVAGQGYIAGRGTVVQLAPGDREDPVEFTGRTLDGARFDVTDHRGEVVVVNVWGSWCPPCIAEAADLQDVWAAAQGNGVQFVGINFRDNRDAALAHERRFGVTYPSIEDEAGETLLQLRGSLPPRAIPSTLVLDRSGRVSARVLGQVPAATLRALVSDALAEPS